MSFFHTQAYIIDWIPISFVQIVKIFDCLIKKFYLLFQATTMRFLALALWMSFQSLALAIELNLNDALSISENTPKIINDKFYEKEGTGLFFVLPSEGEKELNRFLNEELSKKDYMENETLLSVLKAF
ncbi:MAG TPA: hypothetical protein VIH61_07475, partial [Waddliaceae bacterium]